MAHNRAQGKTGELENPQKTGDSADGQERPRTEVWCYSGIRLIFPDDPEGLAPAVASPECHPMPESDDAEIRRRRNELSCPETVGEVSHIPRGERDSATTFGGVLDPLRGVIGCATFPHRIGERVQSRCGHQIRMRRDRPIRQLDLRGRFGAFFAGEGHAHRFDFSFSRRSLPRHGTLRRRLSPEAHRLALSPAFFNEGNESALRSPKQAPPRTGEIRAKDRPKKATLRARSW
jgi:hypothetical protein